MRLEAEEENAHAINKRLPREDCGEWLLSTQSAGLGQATMGLIYGNILTRTSYGDVIRMKNGQDIFSGHICQAGTE